MSSPDVTTCPEVTAFVVIDPVVTLPVVTRLVVTAPLVIFPVVKHGGAQAIPRQSVQSSAEELSRDVQTRDTTLLTVTNRAYCSIAHGTHAKCRLTIDTIVVSWII